MAVWLTLMSAVGLWTGRPVAAAASDFPQNPALNSLFQQLEKQFTQYRKDEVVPLESYELIGNEGEKKNTVPRTVKKITDEQKKAATQRKLNEIRANLEIWEEKLGGLSAQEYKLIADHLTRMMMLAQLSSYGWDTLGKTVSFYLDVREEQLYDFKGLTGNFARMGKEKDQVNPSELKVKERIARYLNQSVQKGNKVGADVLKRFPGEVEKLLLERQPSRIVAGRSLASLHDEILNPDGIHYDGTESVEDLVESFDITIKWANQDRDREKQLEDYVYPADAPSGEFREYITRKLVDGELSDSFASGFKKAITLDELAKLYFEPVKAKAAEPAEEPEDADESDMASVEEEAYTEDSADYALEEDESDTEDRTDYTLEEDEPEARDVADAAEESDSAKIVIDDPAIPADSPDYLKQAYIYGMIDDKTNLGKPLTRVEAARRLMDGTVYHEGINSLLPITDAAKIPVADQTTVGSVLRGGMGTRADKFEPQSGYTREEAIRDRELFRYDSLRRCNIPLALSRVSRIIVGKSTVHLIFSTKADLNSYLEDYLDDTALSKIKPGGKYTKVDTGGALIEFFTPENGVKFTMKTGTTFFDLHEGFYGPMLQYRIEPKVVKTGDKVNMTMQPDTINQKLNLKLDAILAKIFKPGMTDQQKVKAIHDYLVTHITYDRSLWDEQTVDSILVTIDKGRGVCGDYALLFMFLCRRASIPCVFESNYEMEHAWNAVYVGGQWLFVDATWDDDDSGKIKYTYLLKDRYAFMSDHVPIMGVPDPRLFKNLDPMSLKSQDEIRGYLMENFYWTDGYKLSFRVADKALKPIIPYMHDSYVTVKLTYDAKTNLYTVTAKKR